MRFAGGLRPQVQYFALSLFKVYHCFSKQSIKQWQEKFCVNFSCHCLIKFTIIFLSNQLNNGKKSMNFSCYCLIKFTIVFLSNQLNNGKKSVNFSCHCLIKFTI